jgi:hypothetical protein
MVTRRSISITLVLALASVLLLFQSALVSAQGGPSMLEFKSMVGVSGAFKNSGTATRGVNGAGLAWTVATATGELTTAGHLELKVTGLVFAEGANTGSNTVANFRAVVSCLDSNAQPVNRMTEPFPATLGAASAGGGNANVEANLTLPDPCIAPIVFVTSPGGAWFTITGG